MPLPDAEWSEVILESCSTFLAQSPAPAYGTNTGVIFALVASIFILVIALVVVFMVLERKRSQKIDNFAKSLGFTFRKTPTDSDRTLLDGSQLCNAGSDPRFSNILEASAPADARITIFDFAYTTPSSDDHDQTTNQTVVRLEGPLLNLSAFFLRPESFFSKALKLVGLEDINFAEHPEFSKRYLLSGQDEAAVRRVFTPAMVEFCKQHPRICVEGVGDKLFYYRAGVRQKPDNLPTLLDEGKRLFALFVDAGRTSS